MNTTVERPTIQKKIAELTQRKAELESRHGRLRRDYGAARLDQEMGAPGATARLEAISREMVEVSGEISDATAMLTAAAPRAQAQRTQNQQAAIEADWKKIREHCQKRLETIRALAPVLAEAVRLSSLQRAYADGAYAVAHRYLSPDMQALLTPKESDSANLAEAEQWAGQLLARAPVDLDDKQAA